jgi:DNA-binding NtrC family response regulator
VAGTVLSPDPPEHSHELANAIERAVVLGQPPTINIEDLSPGIFAAEVAAGTASTSQTYHETVDQFRREVIVNALAQTHGNRAAAARLLGLERSYLLKLMKSFNVS